MKRRDEDHAKLAKKEEEMLTENTEAAVQLNSLALGTARIHRLYRKRNALINSELCRSVNVPVPE